MDMVFCEASFWHAGTIFPADQSIGRILGGLGMVYPSLQPGSCALQLADLMHEGHLQGWSDRWFMQTQRAGNAVHASHVHQCKLLPGRASFCKRFDMRQIRCSRAIQRLCGWTITG